ncbi:MAG: GtrA family protein [Bacteroidales bacterium]|nr:GtrA family protein [Bacteroidales bacterium]
MRMKILNTLFVDETSNGFIQLFRYLFVGGFAFVVDYGLLYALTEWAGLYYLVSASISFLAGLVVNYLLSTGWIFKNSKMDNKVGEFIIFSIIGVIGLGLNSLLLYAFTDWIHIHYMISKLLTAALVMLWNFFARKIILFTK